MEDTTATQTKIKKDFLDVLVLAVNLPYSFLVRNTFVPQLSIVCEMSTAHCHFILFIHSGKFIL